MGGSLVGGQENLPFVLKARKESPFPAFWALEGDLAVGVFYHTFFCLLYCKPYEITTVS